MKQQWWADTNTFLGFLNIANDTVDILRTLLWYLVYPPYVFSQKWNITVSFLGDRYETLLRVRLALDSTARSHHDQDPQH